MPLILNMRLLINGNYDYSMAVTKVPFPAWQSLKENEEGVLEPYWPKLIDKSSQQIGELFVDNGSTYAIKVEALKKRKSLNGKQIRGYKMDFFRSVD